MITKNNSKLKSIINKWQKQHTQDDNRYDQYINRTDIGLNIKQCFKENRPMYCFGDIQSGKSLFKRILAAHLIDRDLTDIVIIQTTNLTHAMDQLQSKMEPFFTSNIIECVSSDDIGSLNILSPRKVIFTMTNYRRVEKITQVIEKTKDAYLKKYNDDYDKIPRFTVILDEGEEMEMAAGNPSYDGSGAQTEQNMWKWLEVAQEGVEIQFVKVSGTLSSALATSFVWTGNYGDVKPYQLFDLPTGSDYQGLRKTNGKVKFNASLVPEQKHIFTSNGFTQHANNWWDSANMGTIADEVENILQRDPYSLPHIINMVYGTKCDSHHKVANWIAELMDVKFGRKSDVWSSGPVQNLKPNCEVVCIVHNNTTSHININDKIRQVADSQRNIRAIFVMGDKMLNKSITVDSGYTPGAGSWSDVNSPYFGMYCNITIRYASEYTNVEQDIQYMRCTGPRPDIKEHLVICTPTLQQDIQEYYETQDNMIKDCKRRNGWNMDDVIVTHNNLSPRRRLGKATVNKRLNRFNGGKRKGYPFTSDKQRSNLMNQGFRERDRLFQLTDSEYDSLVQDRNDKKTVQTALGKGFVQKNSHPKGSKPQVNVSYPINADGSPRHWSSADSARAKMKVGDTNAEWIFTLFEANGDKWLYCYNKILIPAGMDEVEYKFDFDPITQQIARLSGGLMFSYRKAFIAQYKKPTKNPVTGFASFRNKAMPPKANAASVLNSNSKVQLNLNTNSKQQINAQVSLKKPLNKLIP